MQTTLDIGDDVLSAAREKARADGKSVDQVITDLARQALSQSKVDDNTDGGELEFLGFRPLPKRGVVITNEMVNRIREEEGI